MVAEHLRGQICGNFPVETSETSQVAGPLDQETPKEKEVSRHLIRFLFVFYKRVRTVSRLPKVQAFATLG